MESGIVEKFRLQRESASILERRLNPTHDPQLKTRQSHCLCSLQAFASTVDLLKSDGADKAHYKGLQTCGSPWACPVCATKISEHRKNELQELIDKAQARGKEIYMITFTLPHYAHESCDEVLTRFKNVRKKMKYQVELKKSPEFLPWRKLLKYYKYDGSVTTMEVTYTANGWHVHSHDLFIFDEKIQNLPRARERFFDAWLKASDLEFKIADFDIDKLKAFYIRSVRIDHLEGDTGKIISEYFTKQGISKVERSSEKWGLAEELTKSHMKKKESESLTPFGILNEITKTDNQKQKSFYRQKFFEYAQAFKGTSFVRFSPGLRDKYDMQYLTDDQVASSEQDELKEWYGFFEAGEWKNIILKNKLRGWVLEHSSLEWNELVSALTEKLKGIKNGDRKKRIFAQTARVY